MSDSPTKTPVTQPKNTFTKLALISLVALGAAWLVNQKGFSETLAPQVGEDSLKPKSFQGSVVKTLEQFSLTAKEGGEYHIFDPNNLLNDVAKKRGIKGDLYEMKEVCIKGIVSPVGNYGHLGRYERQITVTSVE